MSQFQRIAIALSQVCNSLIDLTAFQQHYLSRVLRLREGDRFLVLDGLGHCWLTRLIPSPTGKGLGGEMLEEFSLTTELPVDVTLIAALPKGNAFDDVVRQVTELGVNCIIPVISDRTLLKPSPQKLERWRRIALEASEQSERVIIPTIADPLSWRECLETVTQGQRFICEARGEFPHLLTVLAPPQPPQPPFIRGENEFLQSPIPNPYSPIPTPLFPSISIGIGPEGGWTEDELKDAIESGFQAVSLGSRIFRAVTAPLVALSLIAAKYESI